MRAPLPSLSVPLPWQHDAACRIIARLVKERDDARQALTNVKLAPPEAAAAAPNLEAGAPQTGMTPEIVSTFEATSKTLSKGRKKRAAPPGQADADAIAAFKETGAKGLHGAGAVCVDVHASEALAATGGADGKVRTFDCGASKAKATMKGHSGQVTRVRLHPSKPLVVSCGHDCSLRVWGLDGKQKLSATPHSAAVTDCTLHATGDYCVTASADRSWALSDLDRGESILSMNGSPLAVDTRTTRVAGTSILVPLANGKAIELDPTAGFSADALGLSKRARKEAVGKLAALQSQVASLMAQLTGSA